MKPEEVGLSSARLARIGEHWQRYIDAGKLAGTLTLIARRGKVAYCEALGHLEIERRRPVTRRFGLAHLLHDQAHHERGADDALRAGALPARRSRASVHPVVEEPRGLRRTATIPCSRRRRPRGAMTIRDLLSHTSGLTYGFMERSNVDAAYRKLAVGDRTKAGYTLADMIATLAELPLEFSPGHALELLGRHRRSRSPDRGHLRAAARRLPGRARLRAAGHARHELRHPRRSGGAVRRELRAAGRRHAEGHRRPHAEPVPAGEPSLRRWWARLHRARLPPLHEHAAQRRRARRHAAARAEDASS